MMKGKVWAAHSDNAESDPMKLDDIIDETKQMAEETLITCKPQYPATMTSMHPVIFRLNQC